MSTVVTKRKPSHLQNCLNASRKCIKIQKDTYISSHLSLVFSNEAWMWFNRKEICYKNLRRPIQLLGMVCLYLHV